jgi:hypothetical protein
VLVCFSDVLVRMKAADVFRGNWLHGEPSISDVVLYPTSLPVAST